jgi:tetratricopeptide (TPR) repeat protein
MKADNLVAAEASLRRALKLKPTFTEARINLGLTLTFLGRLRDARASFAKVLKAAPRNTQALFGIGQVTALEGRFEEAETAFKRIVDIDPKMTSAWASLAGTRKMTDADGEWFKNAEKLATSNLHPLEEANLRFAMGKYFDDLGKFASAFQNFKRGNELLKTAAADYDGKERSRLIDDLIRVYSPEAIKNIGAAGSSSVKPVFVVGMPRSGTSLAEQIIASHPAASGAGELQFWAALVAEDPGLRDHVLSESARPKVAEQYLRTVSAHSRCVLRKCVARRRQGACELRFSGLDLLGVPQRPRHLHAEGSHRYVPVLLFPAVLAGP